MGGDDVAVWVPLAATLVVAIMMIALAIYITHEVPAIEREQEAELSEDLGEAFTALQQDVLRLRRGDLATASLQLATTPTTIYSPTGGVGTLTVDASGPSAIRTVAHDGRRDFESGAQRSEGGLGENVYIGGGAITLDDRWWGDRFITNTHRIQAYQMTSYAYMYSMRFVAQATGTVDTARAFVYTYASDYPSLKLTYTDGEYQYLYPVADAWVKEDAGDPAEAGTNYGLDEEVKAGASSTSKYRAFLKFDGSRVPAGKTIQTAQLTLSCTSVYGSPTLDACQVTDDSWTNAGITWNNMPAVGSTTDTQSPASGYETYYWAMTAFVQGEFSGDGIASIALKAQNETPTESNTAYFHSMEHLSAKLWIAGDSDGRPSDVIGNQAVAPFAGENGGIWSNWDDFGWVYADNLNAPVTEGSVYHLVVAPQAAYNYPNEYAYISVAHSAPRNVAWVDGGVANDNRSVLFYGRENPEVNERWTEFPDYEPVYVLEYADGTYEGNPYHPGFKFYSEEYYYSDIGAQGDDGLYISFAYSNYNYSAGRVRSTGGAADDEVWGENFYVSSPMTINAFEVAIDRHGLPGYDLEVAIENSDWREVFTLGTGSVWASGTPEWHRFRLSQPRTLAAGNYWIYLRTKGYTSYDYYVVPLDNADGLYGVPTNLSWDGANSRAFYASMPSSSDTMRDVSPQLLDDVDMPFRLIQPNYRSPGAYTSPVLRPGGRVRWLDVTWGEDVPAGTSATVEVRVGSMAHPEDPNVFDDPDYPWAAWAEVQQAQSFGDVFGENRVASCLQYRVTLSASPDNTLAPVVDNVRVRYYDGTGTTREQPALRLVHTTSSDFGGGLDESGSENVSVGGGAVKLLGATGEGWETRTGPTQGVGGANGHRIEAMGSYIYMWVAYGGPPGGSEAVSTDFYGYNPPTDTWSSDWNTGYTETAPFGSPYGIGLVRAKDPSNNPAIYIMRGYWSGTLVQFARWTEAGGWVSTLNTTIPFADGGRTKEYPANGTEMVWDGGDRIYLFPGSGYSYSWYDFYYYSISGDTWTYAGTTPYKHGPGNAGCLVEYGGENYIYLHFGHTPSSDYTFAEFWRYELPSGPWTQCTKHEFGADDGADLVWDGGDYIYHTPGAYKEGLPLADEDRFLRYSISNDSWEELDDLPAPAEGGWDDGGSLGVVGGYIYALKGGSDVPDAGGTTPANDFYRYCLPNYTDNGYYVSELFDAGEEVNWERITSDTSTPSGTSVTPYVRFDAGTGEAGWTQVSLDSALSARSRYFRYRVYLGTTSSSVTPSVNSVVVEYSFSTSSSSWTQTDWSGGATYPAYQADQWGDTYDNYYDNDENIDTSTTGEVKLKWIGLGVGENLTHEGATQVVTGGEVAPNYSYLDADDNTNYYEVDAAASGGSEANMLDDPGFESGGTSYWSQYGVVSFTVQSGTVYAGSYAAKIVDGAKGTGYIYQVEQVTGGSNYNASVWGHATDANAKAQLRIYWYESTDGTGTNIGSNTVGTTASTGSWEELSGLMTAPGAAQSCKVELYFNGLQTAGKEVNSTVYFDGASFAASGGAATYSLDIRHDSEPASYSGTIDNIGVKLNFKSSASATYTFQIYKWSGAGAGWVTLNSSSVGTSEVTWDSSITTSPADYISPTDNILVRLYTSEEASAHRSQEDLLEFRVRSTPPGYYGSPGTLTSSIYDANDNVDWGTLSWSATTPGGTSVTAEVRTGNTQAPDGGWTGWSQVSNGGSIPGENSRYIQYRISPSTTDTSTTPVFQSVTLQYNEIGVGAAAPVGSTVFTWTQTTRSDFVGTRTPNAVGTNIEVVAPGDITLQATGYWGNEFAGSSGYSPQSRLDGVDKLISMRFTARSSGTLKRARLLCQVTEGGVAKGPGDSLGGADDDNWWRVRLCTDNPDGTPNLSTGVLAENYGFPDKEWSWEWYMPYPRLGVYESGEDHPGVPLSASIAAGQVYHLVIDANPSAPAYISSENYITVVAVKPIHDNWINNETYNSERGVLYSSNGGVSWQDSSNPISAVYNREPVYVLEFEGGTYEGNPYYKSGDEICQHNYAGEAVLIDDSYGASPGDNIGAGAVEFYVQQDGNPGEFLVGIDAGGTRLDLLRYAEPIDCPDFSWDWARFTFRTPYTLWENESYQVYAMSPSSDWNNHLTLNTMKTSWADKTSWVSTTYGGIDSQYIWSSDGSSWHTKDYREIPFRFVTGYGGSGTYVSETFDAGQMVDWQYIEWDATRPPGTGVNVYVVSGGTRYGPFTSQGSLDDVPNSQRIRYEIELTASGASAPAVHEVRIGYRGGFGSIRASVGRDLPRTWAFEGTAVILEQDGASVMRSDPVGIVVVSDEFENGDQLPSGTIRVEVNKYLLASSMGVGGGSTRSVSLSMPQEPVATVRPGAGTNRGSVDVTVLTDFPQAWRSYFDDISRDLNQRAYAVNSSVSCDLGGGEVTLTIDGPGGGGDIYYGETVYELEVTIG